MATPAPQLIVQLKPGADPSAVAKSDNVALIDTTPNAPFALYGVTSGTAAAAQARLRVDVRVAWAEDNAEAGSPEDTGVQQVAPVRQKGSSLGVIGGRSAVLEGDANALLQIDWQASLAASAGRTVRLAVLDTGLSRTQTAL